MNGLNDCTYHRIIALIDIPRHGVKAGDIGGWIQSEYNLSHEGDCWVADEASVRDKARIRGNAIVKFHAHISEGALVEEDAQVGEYAHIRGNAWVSQEAVIAGRVTLADNAVVRGNAKLLENEKMGGIARYYGTWEYGLKPREKEIS